MATYTIENEKLSVTIDAHGAELSSIYDKKNDRELIWQADPAFWNRHAPVLFPNVGKYYGGHFTYNGKAYPMGQHGFARDTEFEQIAAGEDFVTYRLCADEESKKKYPFDFVICSQHAINRSELYFGNFFLDKTQHEAYEYYYKELYDIIKVYKNYSVLGHLDLVKRYGNYGKVLDDKPFDDIIEAILKQAIYDGKGIEVNTSCYRYNLPDLTPSRHILNMYKDLGGEIITTGSDSHNPAQIAYNFDYIYSYLQSIGFKYVCSFDKMNPQFIKI